MMLFFMKLVAGMALVVLSIIIALIYEGVDRIVHARMQNRIGPPVLQPVYDILKLMGKESIVPRRAVPWLFNGAPWLAAVAAMMVILYIPIGSLPPILTGNGDMILIIYLFALSAVSMVVAGFSSGSPYANVGAQREMVLMMSYELPLALVISTLAWAAYRLGLPGHPFSTETYVIMPLWGALGKVGVVGMCALLVTLLAVVPAETGKVPMDIPEAKTEILEGLIAEGKGDMMITEVYEAVLYSRKDERLYGAFTDKPLTKISFMGFLIQKDDPDFLRVMNYLWNDAKLRGDLEQLFEKWLR